MTGLGRWLAHRTRALLPVRRVHAPPPAWSLVLPRTPAACPRRPGSTCLPARRAQAAPDCPS